MAAESIVSAFLPVIIDKLISPAIQQICLAFGYDDKLQKLKRILEKIQSVLVDAEKRQTADTSIKDWLSDLKNISYEAEDVLEEFEFEAERKKRSLNQDNLKRKVLFYCSFPNRIMTRFSLCRRLNKIIKKIEDISNEIQRFNFQLNGVPQISYCRPPTHSHVDQKKVIGREKDKEDIVSFLINHVVSNNKNIVVIPIVAMGGMGKTTLSQLVYRDHRVEDYFCLRIWVCVSDADFDVVRLVRLIIEAATKKECKLSNMELLQEQLREIISGKRYLIILDDVWNEDPTQWEELKTLLSDCGREGSSVVVSTRSEVAAKTMATQTIHYLKCLPEEDSWELFRRKAFAEGAEEPASLVKIGKDIIKRCGGLPLAISTLGSMMRLKNDEDQWKAVLDSELWEMKAAKDNILPALRLSYSHLPPHLKQCFAFCAIYPKDYKMYKDTLIQLWMANGYIPSDGKGDLETIGKDIFDELVWRSFFQDVLYGKYGKVSCKMHDLIHDLAQSIMGKECLNFAHAPKLEVIPSTTRHLRIPEFPELNSPLNQSILPTIRTIVGPNLPIKVASKLKSLRVLNLSGANLNKNASIRQLIHLRWLDLSCTEIKELPEGICSLYNLQTLILSECYNLEKLPDNLADLVNLRHLDIFKCKKLVCMPIRMGRLKQLHTLTNYIVSAKAKSGIEQLRDLNLDGRLMLCGLKNVSNAMDAEDASLSSKQNLYSIELDWGGAGSLDVFEALKPHSRIKILKVWNYGGQQFPTWMNVPQQLQNLVKIELSSCSKCQELPSLGKLPFLKVLLLHQLDNVKHIISKQTRSDIQLRTTLFPSLEYVNLSEMKNLEDWWEAEGSNALASLPQGMKHLTDLFIFDCNGLMSLPEDLLKLDHLHLRECNGLVSLPQGMEHLTDLRISDCNGLMSLPEDLLKLNNLELSKCNGLASLPQGMKHLTDLLIFYCNGLMSLPEDLLKLDHLHLRECNGLVSLPQGMEHLFSLTIFDCNGLMSLPEDLLKLGYLSLNKCNGLVSLPQGMEHLISLTISDCNGLMSLPEDLLKLVYLNLNKCNGLVSLPQGMKHLTYLRIFDCNGLMALPEDLLKLDHLVLSKWNALASLPQGMEHLTTLTISDCNGLMSLPEDLLKLKVLSLGICNGLVSLPQGMEHLTNLSIFDCNGLMSLPEDLLKLNDLNLRKCNGLVSLPERMEGLTQLKHLKISECDRLRSLPEGLLLRLPTLTSLKIIGQDELIRPFKIGGEYWKLIENIPDRVIKLHEHRQESSPSTSKCSCLGQSF